MIAIVSDLHSNLEAVEAVMDQCLKLGVTQFVCLGDVIGYGPDPLAVSAIAQKHFSASLMGNHEEALVTGKHRFNPLAARAIDWTREELSSQSNGTQALSWFKERMPFVLKGNMLLVHGSIYDPVHDYVDEPENPIEAQQMIETLGRDFSGFDICCGCGAFKMQSSHRRHCRIREVIVGVIDRNIRSVRGILINGGVPSVTARDLHPSPGIGKRSLEVSTVVLRATGHVLAIPRMRCHTDVLAGADLPRRIRRKSRITIHAGPIGPRVR